MNPDQIREILNNFNNLKWDNVNYNNFVAHVKALDLNTLDEEFKQKVVAFLQEAQTPKDFGSSAVETVSSDQNIAVNNIESQALSSFNNSGNNDDQFNDSPIASNASVVDGLNLNDENPVVEPPSLVSETLIENSNDNQNPIVEENQILKTEPQLSSNEQLITGDDKKEEVIEPKKEKKKSNLVVVILLLLVLVAIVAYALIYLEIIPNPLASKTPPPVVDNNDNGEDLDPGLVCTINEHDEIGTSMLVEVNVLFDENDNVKSIIYITNYQFNNNEDYQMWKESYENMEVTDTTVEFFDEQSTGKTTLTVNIEDLDNGSLPNDYEGIRNYFLSLGHECDQRNNQANTDNDNNNEEDFYSITDKINVSNNLFEYKNLYFDALGSASEYAVGWVETVTNKSGAGQLLNIYLKFYDENKNEIGEYKLIPVQEVSETSMFYIAANDSKNMNFNIDNSSLIEGKTIQNIKYFSVEDLF